MRDLPVRNSICESLQSDSGQKIGSFINRHSASQDDCRAMVSTAAEFPGGIQSLVSNLLWYEGDSYAMRDVKSWMDENFPPDLSTVVATPTPIAATYRDKTIKDSSSRNITGEYGDLILKDCSSITINATVHGRFFMKDCSSVAGTVTLVGPNAYDEDQDCSSINVRIVNK